MFFVALPRNRLCALTASRADRVFGDLAGDLIASGTVGAKLEFWRSNSSSCEVTP